MESSLYNFGMWEDANLLEIQVSDWLGTVSMKQQWFIFSALKDSLKMKKKFPEANYLHI